MRPQQYNTFTKKWETPVDYRVIAKDKLLHPNRSWNPFSSDCCGKMGEVLVSLIVPTAINLPAMLIAFNTESKETGIITSSVATALSTAYAVSTCYFCCCKDMDKNSLARTLVPGFAFFGLLISGTMLFSEATRDPIPTTTGSSSLDNFLSF